MVAVTIIMAALLVAGMVAVAAVGTAVAGITDDFNP
jgi:hypothetical protein